MSEDERPQDGGMETEVVQYAVPGFDVPLAQQPEDRRALIAQLRAAVDAWSGGLDAPRRRYLAHDVVLLRFLRARGWSLAAAEASLRQTAEWRREQRIDEIRAADHESQCKNGKMFVHGVDRHHRPVVYLGVNSEADPNPDERKLRFMVYTIEIAMRRMDLAHGVDKSVWICDCRGYSMKHNGSIGFAKSLLAVLQHHYVETLAALVLLDAPFVFRAMWKMLAPFLDAVTVRKVKFLSLSSADFAREMSEIIEMDNLIASHGGKNPWKYDPEEYFASLVEEERALPPPGE